MNDPRPVFRPGSLPTLRTLVLVPIIWLHGVASGQLALWSDEIEGGLITGSFSLGTATFGYGTFEMPVPTGAIIHQAFLYAIQVGATDGEVTVELNGQPFVFNGSNLGPFYMNPHYGQVSLHTLDVTNDLDPTLNEYSLSVSVDQAMQNTFTEFYVIVAYELPGAGSIHADVFFSDVDSDLLIEHTLITSAPMLTAGGVAFATMAGYANNDPWTDCEGIYVNDTFLGQYYGGDMNAMSSFGASASFHFADGIFTGLGDDIPDQAINGPDVLSDISALVTDGDNSIHVEYEHCPSISPGDNLVNLMILAYRSDPCAEQLDLGSDISVCGDSSITLDAGVMGSSYEWSTGESSRSVQVTSGGNYWVEVSDGECMWNDTIAVEYRPLPVLALGNDRTLCEGEDLELSISPLAGTNVIWSTGSTEESVLVTEPGLFWVSAQLNGCTASDSVLVTGDECAFEIQMPNVFTPNNDGRNDRFSAITLKGIGAIEFMIYDRWGLLLFRSQDPGFFWDGRTEAGAMVPEGVYYWIMEYVRSATGEKGSASGEMLLLR